MKLSMRTIVLTLLMMVVSTTAYSMGAAPQPPAETETPAEYTELGTDMMGFALNAFSSSTDGNLDLQSLLAAFSTSDFIPLGEHNGTTVSMAPCFSGGIAGLTIRLEFDHAVVEVPVDPADPAGEKKTVGTIASGVLDIDAGIELTNMQPGMIVLKFNTPEKLILEDDNQTEIEFRDVKCGFDIINGDPASPESYTVSGTLIVDGYTIDLDSISQLIALMSGEI